MISGEKLTVKLNNNDNVATALKDIEIGETYTRSRQCK
jgi:hypothetical protein